VEKKRFGPGVTEAPRRLDRCGAKHEIEALILTGIRARLRKRLMAREWPPFGEVVEGGTPPSKCIHNKRKGLDEEHFVNT